MHIAVIDDDEDMLKFVEDVLSRDGHRCLLYRNGRSFLAALQRETFDLFIVDWTMPEMSGMEVIQWVKTRLPQCPPVMMLTNRSQNEEIAGALNAGADDFVVKPESAIVLSARVNALLRRHGMGAGGDEAPIHFGGYSFDRRRDVVTLAGEEIQLTSKEFGLAFLFFSNLDRPLSRPYIMETVWLSVASLSTRTLDMHVSRIRAKLALRPENGFSLRTIFGYGYRLEPYYDQG
ncbi:response regulator transcription factor [Sphingobium sufflavum]|jgi:DNA-binding response OmpR family regulator|uniref:response regulator transcription factor n=1 Tax=Sphingobium sufflavum TaxID=1129547 RepID=UPI001F1DD6E7|nr:response regulator transcription factor [Sphingobium sufflavum]MCE7797210.1 response regulator transcription factor [Sphingobium sufflavum]